MLRLRVWNNAESSQYDIELYENAPVNLNYRFTDISQVNKSTGSFSQTFRVPATKNNLDFFGGIIHPDVRETTGLLNANWNVKKKIRAELSYQTVPVMQGTIQVKRVVRQKKQYYDLELVFFGESVDIAQSIGQKKLSDLNLTELDHTLNLNNIFSSWLSLGNFGPSTKLNNIKYGIIDKGSNWQGDIWTTADPIEQSEFTPFLRAKYIIEKIFSEAGFTINSTFLNTSDFENIHMPCFSGGPDFLKGDDFGDNTAKAGLVSNQTTTSTSGVAMDLVDTVTGGSDPGSNFNNTTHKYTAPANQLVYYKVFTIVSSGTSELVHTTAGTEVVVEAMQTGSGANTYREGNLFMTANSTLHIKLKADSGQTATASGVNQVFGVSCYMDLAFVTEPFGNIDIDVALNMPDFKQIDFISSVQKMFNLVFVPDKNNPTRIKVEPFSDYVASGTFKDWTQKLDFNSDIVIEPTADIQSSRYLFSHADGQDFLNDAIQRSLGRTYGSMEVLDLENDFATGNYESKDGFAPFTMSLIPDNTYIVHRLITQDGAGVGKPKPRLAYWNGFSSQFGGYQVRNDSGVVGGLSIIPIFSNYNDLIPTVSSNDLNYGFEAPMIPNVVHPFNNLYQKYWVGLINELYSSDARTLTCKMLLTAEDISQFEFNDQIYVEGTLYRVLEIRGYDATQTTPCSVKLIKILGEVADCADTPTGVSSAGFITFNNSNSDFGSQECCEKYGYIYFPDKSGGNPRCLTAGIFVPPTT